MIEIKMTTNRYKMTVTGHAQPEESAEYKEICAAVSALTQSLAYSISKLNEERGALEQGALKAFDYRGDPGDMKLKAYPEKWAEVVIRQRFRTYGDGLELLAKSHAEAVTMIRDGERILPDEEEKAQ